MLVKYVKELYNYMKVKIKNRGYMKIKILKEIIVIFLNTILLFGGLAIILNARILNATILFAIIMVCISITYFFLLIRR